MSAALERNPVWKNGPLICPKENLPALATLNDLLSFIAKNGPGVYVKSVFQCTACLHWHAVTEARSPSGDSSGSSRNHKHHSDES